MSESARVSTPAARRSSALLAALEMQSGGPGIEAALSSLVHELLSEGMRADSAVRCIRGMLDAAPLSAHSAQCLASLPQIASRVESELAAEQADHDAPAPGSEDELALQFVALHGDAFRWSPGLDWMTTSAHGWARDDLRRRYDAARLICRAKAAELSKLAERKAVSSARTVNAVLELAKSDPRLVLPASAWDSAPMMLNTPAGMVDLATGTLTPRNSQDHVTQCTRVSPDFEAQCPTWHKFLASVFLGDADTVNFMQRLAGYLLTADRREQKLFFSYGLGANGKSTYWDFMAWIAGTYALKLPSHVLLHSHMNSHPTELAQLRGKRVAVSSELEEGQYWAEARIKELTGDESLTARFMRQDFFEFAMTQKHVIVGNFKPRLKGGDPALARRIVLIPFKAQFAGAKRDPNMLTKLRAEAPAVLAWAIAGAVKWGNDGLATPASVTAASSEYMSENDDLLTWIDECCVQLPDLRSKASALYDNYSRWLKARGQHVQSMRLFGDRVSVLPNVSKLKSGGCITYRGIALRADSDHEPDRH